MNNKRQNSFTTDAGGDSRAATPEVSADHPEAPLPPDRTTGSNGSPTPRRRSGGGGGAAGSTVTPRPPSTPPRPPADTLAFSTEDAGADAEDDTSPPTFSVEAIDEETDEIDAPTLRRRTIKRGQGILVRFFSRQVINLPVHYFEPVKDTTLTLRCNGGRGRCALCDGGLDPVVSSLIVVWCVEDADFVVLGPFGREGGPKSLGGMLKTELRRADFARRIVEVRKSHVDNLYRVTPHASVGADEDQRDVDYGDDAIRELNEKGGLDPADIAATVESRTNADLVREYDVLRRRVAARQSKTTVARR